MITSADRVHAIAHCELFATWRSQLAAAATTPPVAPRGVHKVLTPHPIHRMAQGTLTLLLQIDAALGLSPTSRSKVAVRGPAPIRTGIDRARATLFDPSGRS